MKHPLKTAAIVLAMSVALPAHAQFAKAMDAIKYRKASFTVMGAHFGRLGAMANGRLAYDAAAAAANADIVAAMGKLPWAAFGEGADKGDTRAKPEIWIEAGQYKKAADNMQAAVAQLNTAAKVGDLESLKAAFGPSAATCKACHDDFRSK